MEAYKKLLPEFLLSAFVNRKHDIIYPNLKRMPVSSPGWDLLSADLGDKYSVHTLYNMAAEPHIFEALIAEKADIDEHPSSVPKKRVRLNVPHASAENTTLAVTSMKSNEVPPKLTPPNIEDYGLPSRREQLVLPEGYPRSDILIRGESSDKPTRNEKKLHGNTKVERSTVINELLSRRDKIRRSNSALRGYNDPVWQEISDALGNKLKALTIYNIAIQAKVRAIIMKGENKLHGNVKVERSVVINELLSRGDKILQPTSALRGYNDPVWQEISDALGNKLKAFTIWKIARQEKVQAIIMNEQGGIIDSSENCGASSSSVSRNKKFANSCHSESQNSPAINTPTQNVRLDGSMRKKSWTYPPSEDGQSDEITSAERSRGFKEKEQNIVINDKEETYERVKIDHEMKINAIVARREEIINAEGRYVSGDHAVWKRIASDLSNVVSPATIYSVAGATNVRALVHRESSRAVEVEKNNFERRNLRDEVDQMVYEINIRKVLGKDDSRDGLTEEMKRLRKEVEKMNEDQRREREDRRKESEVLRAEIKGLKRKICNRDAIERINCSKELKRAMKTEKAFLGTEEKPILLD